MPLSEAAQRSEVHHRVIDMKTYARADGLYDVEAHLLDRKPFPLLRPLATAPVPAGQPLHDLWVRVTVDADFVVQAIEASSDVTPFPLCRAAEPTLQVLVGERIAKGWSAKVRERLRGTASCTHLMEMLIPLATTAIQGIRVHKRLSSGKPVETGDAPANLNTCYAYAADRDVVKRLWPQHYRPAEAQAQADIKK